MERLNVRLSAFEGPMDLLCHLIEKNELDIYDIPIVELTEQYMEFLEAESMESMSEFVLMAATLLEIKSKMLLPQPKKDEPEGFDPRAELVNRLIEYKRFKQAAEGFSERAQFARRYVYRAPDSALLDELRAAYAVPQSKLVDEVLDGISAERLFEVFKSVLASRELKTDRIRSGFNSVRRDMFTVDDKISDIRHMLRSNNRLVFCELFSGGVSRLEKVVIFLAVLELIKRDEVRIQQDSLFDDIYIFGKGVC